MGRKAKEAELIHAYPDPSPPDGITEEAAEWWTGVVRQKPGQLGPTEVFMMRTITKLMKLGQDYAERLDVESDVRQNYPEFSATTEKTVLENYSTCISNITKLAGEMGLTPRSRRQVVAVTADRKKKAAPKTSLDALKPKTFKPSANGNGKHVGR